MPLWLWIYGAHPGTDTPGPRLTKNGGQEPAKIPLS